MIYISHPDNDAIIWPWNVILRVPHPSFFLKNEMQMFQIIFFSGRIRVNTPRMLSKWEYKKTSKDSKRKIGPFRNIYQETPSHVVWQ